jgi:hypothetical protein
MTISCRPALLDDRVVRHTLSIADSLAFEAIASQARPEFIGHLTAQIDVRVSVEATGA